MEKELINLRADSLPLLYSLIKQLGLAESVNASIKVHGNWEGTLPGELLELWLCYLLNTGDHRLSVTEEWAEQQLDLLRVLSGIDSLTSYDFSDDKLGLLLDYFSDDASWDKIETYINSNLLSVYRLEKESELNTFRLDAAPMQTYGKISEDGLIQYGHNKHHPNLAQFKVKLMTLDNSVNHFAHPICHLSVEGNRADDELYIPIIAKSKEVLNEVEAYRKGNLFVGDKKFGSIGNRAYVVGNEDYYLTPLSLVQLSKEERLAFIKASNTEEYQQVFKTEKKEHILVAQGFEVTKELEHTLAGQTYNWTERRLFVLSESYAKSQKRGLEKRLAEAQEAILKLNGSKKGKKRLTSNEECQERITAILKEYKVEGLLEVDIKETQTTKTLRAYKERPKREVTQSHFEFFCQRKEEAITVHKLYLGWQVYATNTPTNLLSYQTCVWKYRYQSNIESRFDDLRNKMVPLLPVFLQKDKRIKGLVNVLMLALKVCSMMEYKAAKALKDQNQQLTNVYEGNPKRGTERPSAKRMLRVFEGISISLIFVEKQLQFALMTKLEDVQLNILELLGIKPEIYSNLSSKIEMFFSENNITET